MATALNSATMLPILWRRKYTLIAGGVLLAGIAFAVAMILPTQYTAEGQMVIQNHSENVPELGSATITSTEDPALTPVDILKSRGLLERVVRNLHLVDTPYLKQARVLPPALATQIDSLRGYIRHLLGLHKPIADPLNDIVDVAVKRLTIKATDHSRVILLRFQFADPVIATAVVNNIMTSYMAIDEAFHAGLNVKVDRWLTERAAIMQQEADAADAAVAQFIRTHRLPEVQGSSTADVQLSRDQSELANARQQLAKQRATLDTMNRLGIDTAHETLDSRTIQVLKERESALLQQLSVLGPNDPRRQPINLSLISVRAQMNNEMLNIIGSLRRSVEIASANVAALESAVGREEGQAQDLTVARATLTQLRNDASAKRGMYINYVTNGERTRLAAAQLPSSPRILFEANTPQLPAYSFGLLSSVLGFFTGVFLLSGWVVLREVLQPRVRSTAELTALQGLQIYGGLPLVAARTTPLLTETLRAMWMTMRAVSARSHTTTIVVTSSEIGEGKTTVATLLAARIAADGFRVLLIDADMRRPRLASLVHIQAKETIETVLLDHVPLKRAVVAGAEMDYLLARGDRANPVKGLVSEQFQSLVMEAQQNYEFVIFDSPPVLHTADAILIAAHCEHVLFVIEAGRLSSKLVENALDRFGDRSKIGVLLTKVRQGDLEKRDYYGGYTQTRLMSGA